MVELFSRRDFECDCGTTRMPTNSPCSLRTNANTGVRGDVHSEEPRRANRYNQNFRNRFCGCEELYDPHKQKGVMFQCLGLGSVDDGGCGEDWWHPECIMGIGKQWREQLQRETTTNGTGPDGSTNQAEGSDGVKKASHENDVIGDSSNTENKGSQDELDDDQLPDGFPAEADFEHFLCYKCVDAFPWIRRYAGTPGFLPAVIHRDANQSRTNDQAAEINTTHELKVPAAANVDADASARKRKLDSNAVESGDTSDAKRIKVTETTGPAGESTPGCRYENLPDSPSGEISLFLRENFRDHLCRCHRCFPGLKPHPQLLEEEDTYEPPISEGSSNGQVEGSARSAGSKSLLDRGEAALSNMDRVRAIEGVMAYNHLKDKVKHFLKPFAESGQAVGAEDVKKYFEKLRGDEQPIRDAGQTSAGDDEGGGNGNGNGDGDGDGGCNDSRRQQEGY